MRKIYHNDGKLLDLESGRYYRKNELLQVEESIRNIFGKNGLIAIIEDKSVESALCIIGATCADRDVMILDERYAKKALSEIIGKYEINGVIGKKCIVNKVLGSVEDLIFGLGYEKFRRNFSMRVSTLI